MIVNFKRTIGIVELPGRYPSLALALEEAGISAERIQPLLSEALSLRCIQCGATAPGGSFIALGLPNPEAIAASRELQRLSQKRCLAEKCPCCFYDLQFAAAEGVNWEAIWSAAQSIREQARLRRTGSDRRWLQTLMEKEGTLQWAAAAAVLLLMLSWFLYPRLRTPVWAQPLPVYRGDTNAVASP